jgi:lipopolysaccharide transport system permease protein
MLFASPVAYSANLIPEKWRLLYDLNPLSGIIEGFRWALLGGRPFPLDALLISTVLGILCFISGSLIFNRLERGFADTI